MKQVAFDLDRNLYMEFLARCHEESLDPDTVLSAWVKRALRQDKTIMPYSLAPGHSRSEDGGSSVVRLRATDSGK